jgi:hypothetical protein
MASATGFRDGLRHVRLLKVMAILNLKLAAKRPRPGKGVPWAKA